MPSKSTRPRGIRLPHELWSALDAEAIRSGKSPATVLKEWMDAAINLRDEKAGALGEAQPATTER